MCCGLSFLFPMCCDADLLVALTLSGLIGRSTTILAVHRPGAACFPRRAPALFSAGDSEAGSVRSRNSPVVTSSTAVPTLTQRAGHLERNPGVSRVPAIHGFPRQSCDERNVSTLIYAFLRARYAGTLAAALHKGSKIFSRDFPERGQPVAFHGIGRTRHCSKTRNVSSQKHETRPGRFLIPENAVLTPVTD